MNMVERMAEQEKKNCCFQLFFFFRLRASRVFLVALLNQSHKKMGGIRRERPKKEKSLCYFIAARKA